MREAGISPAEQVVFEKSAMDSDAHLARNLFLGIVVVIGTSLTQYTYTTFGPSILKNIGLATQTSLLSTTITMLRGAAPGRLSARCSSRSSAAASRFPGRSSGWRCSRSPMPWHSMPARRRSSPCWAF